MVEIDDELLGVLRVLEKRSRFGRREDEWLFGRVMSVYAKDMLDIIEDYNKLKREMLSETDNEDGALVDRRRGSGSIEGEEAAADCFEGYGSGVPYPTD